MATTFDGVHTVLENFTYKDTTAPVDATLAMGGDSDFKPSTTVSSGTGTDQADLWFVETITLGAAGTKTYDFGTGGGETDRFGNVFEPAKIKYIRIESVDGNQSTITVGGGLTNPLAPWWGATTHTEVLNAGDNWSRDRWGTGYTVTNNSADQLLITNDDGSNSATYTIKIAATSA